MPSTSTTGADQPATEGRGYGNKVLQSSNPEIVVPPGTVTGSVAMRADPANSGDLFIGWDDNVSAADGFILQAGDTLSLKIDSDSQPIYAIAGTDGDSLRWIAVN